MAIADSVPGVSGGTIAFLLGFYDRFIGSLNDLITGPNDKRKEAVIFLLKWGIGWVIGFCLSVLVISNLFETHVYALSSLFFGLTFFAIFVVAREEWDSIKGRYLNIIFLLVGAAIVVAISVISNNLGESKSFDSITVGLVIYTFIAAMLAISAMVLPGISGSTLLLCFEIYIPVINSVKELLHLNFKYLPMLIVFGLGIVTGVILIIKSVKKCLEKYRSQTIYTVLGLMVGSLYAVLQGPTTLDDPQPAVSLDTFNIIAFIGGALVLFILEALRYIMEKKSEEPESQSE
ncbi:MAG: DUF368 domain-containing protein [Ruminococcus sp.]|nr:DUF368 domain-containing protein [Ruminococcus sp.]